MNVVTTFSLSQRRGAGVKHKCTYSAYKNLSFQYIKKIQFIFHFAMLIPATKTIILIIHCSKPNSDCLLKTE
jgi:hypothetical protein